MSFRFSSGRSRSRPEIACSTEGCGNSFQSPSHRGRLLPDESLLDKAVAGSFRNKFYFAGAMTVMFQSPSHGGRLLPGQDQ